MDIARECQSFEEFRDKVSDEFVRGQERIPRMSVDDFARISWDYARMLGSEGDDLYGDHELAVMAREAANAEDLKTWVEQNRPDIVQLMRSGTETSLETWLRALYHDANGTDGEAVQEATNVASILDEERRREKSLDNRFKELVGTDDGLVREDRCRCGKLVTNPVDFGEFRIGPERWQVLVGLGGGMDAGLSVSAGFMWTSGDIGEGRRKK